MEELLEGGFAAGDGDGSGGCAHHNHCLRVKAAFAGRVKFLGNKAFAGRAAITAAVVWCRGSACSGGGGGGGEARRTRRWLLILCGDGSTSKKRLPPKRCQGMIFLDPLPTNIFYGRSFLPITTSSSMTLWNRRTRKTLHGRSLSPFATSNARNKNHSLLSLHRTVYPNGNQGIL